MGTNVYAPGTRLGDSMLASSGQQAQPANQPVSPGTNQINPQAGIYDQIQQSPDWLQSLIQAQQIQDPNKAGFYDQGLQARDIYSNFQPDIHSAMQQYGDQFYNPYFDKNSTEFQAQIATPGFNPFRQNLFDYQIQGNQGDIYQTHRNAFSGDLTGNSQLAGKYFNYINPSIQSFKGGTVGGYNDQGLAAWNKNYAPYLDNMKLNDYASRYFDRNQGIQDSVYNGPGLLNGGNQVGYNFNPIRY